jgi:hypothetical protein
MPGKFIASSTTPPRCMQTHLNEYGFRYNRRDRGYLTFNLIFGRGIEVGGGLIAGFSRA